MSARRLQLGLVCLCLFGYVIYEMRFSYLLSNSSVERPQAVFKHEVSKNISVKIGHHTKVNCPLALKEQPYCESVLGWLLETGKARSRCEAYYMVQGEGDRFLSPDGGPNEYCSDEGCCGCPGHCNKCHLGIPECGRSDSGVLCTTVVKDFYVERKASRERQNIEMDQLCKNWTSLCQIDTNATWWEIPKPASLYKRVLNTKTYREGTGLALDLQQLVATHSGAEQCIKPTTDVQVVLADGCTIHLEHLNEPTHGSKVRKDMFIVNQDLINDRDISFIRSGFLTNIVCKTLYCIKVMKRLAPYTPIQHISFVTPVHLPGMLRFSSKVVLHEAGASWMKNTAATLIAWHRHPEWPLLIVTCRTFCLEFLEHDDAYLPAVPEDIMRNTSNLIIFLTKISTELLDHIREIASVALMPSGCEGFGHAIHQGAALGKIVITSDVPPINEFYTNEDVIFLDAHSSYPLGSNTAPRYMKLAERFSAFAGASGTSCFVVDTSSIEHGMDRLLKMSPSQVESMRYRAYSAWKRHTEQWLPQLEKIGCSAENNVNVPRPRLQIEYHSKVTEMGTSIVTCPEHLHVRSGGCNTKFGIKASYPHQDSNSWICSSLERERVVATVICTNIATNFTSVEHRGRIFTSCPVETNSPETLLASVGCEALADSPIETIGVQDYRKGICWGGGAWHRIHVACVNTQHPISHVRIITGRDGTAWCPIYEIAVGGGCRALDDPKTVVISEPVNICSPKLGMTVQDQYPVVCSGWRCVSEGDSAQIVMVMCMVSP